MLFEYILAAITDFILEFTLVSVHPELIKFLEQKGEFTASNGVKIRPGPTLELGPADGTTGYPRYINGIGKGLLQAHNKGSTAFLSAERRARYTYGLRMALVDLTTVYKSVADNYNFPIPYVITFLE